MKLKLIDLIILGLCFVLLILLLQEGFLWIDKTSKAFTTEEEARIAADSVHTAKIQELRQEMLDTAAAIREP